jgi:hypothetical protein
MEKVDEWEITRVKDVKYRLSDYYRDGTYKNVAQMFEDLKQMVHLLEKHVVKNEKNNSR